jgi:membrane-associated phospholipid phosphatase
MAPRRDAASLHPVGTQNFGVTPRALAAFLPHTGMTSDPRDNAGDVRFDHRVGRRDVTEWRSTTGRRLASGHQCLADTVGAHRALMATLAVGGGIATLASFGAAQIYDAVTSRNGIESLDGPALRLAKSIRSPALDAGAAAVPRAFGPVGMPVLTLGAAAALAARQRHLTPVTLLTTAGAGSLAMTLAGRNMIRRNRPHRRDAIPPSEKSPSFPSGHTLNPTTILGTLAYLLALGEERNGPQAAVIGAAAGTALTVGLSRVLLGAHWFTDVLVGWTTGAGWLSLVITSHRLYLTSQAHDD